MFNVIMDTREQVPLSIPSQYIIEVKRQQLPVGDYSIEGLEHLFSIERKASVSEIFNNIFNDPNWSNKLKKLRNLKYSFLLLEFGIKSIMEFPFGTAIPKKHWKKLKNKAPFILKHLTNIMCSGTNVVFANNADNAGLITASIIKSVWDKENAS